MAYRALARDAVSGVDSPTLSQTRDGVCMRTSSAPVAKKVSVGQHELVRSATARHDRAMCRLCSTAHVCTCNVRRLPAVGHARAGVLCPGPGRFRGRLTRRGRINEEGVVTAS